MVGLVTRNADNKITADMTKSLSKSAGFVETGAVNGEATISLPADKNYFYIIVPLEDSKRTAGNRPGVTLTKDSVSWKYSMPRGFAMNCRIYYGYY